MCRSLRSEKDAICEREKALFFQKRLPFTFPRAVQFLCCLCWARNEDERARTRRKRRKKRGSLDTAEGASVWKKRRVESGGKRERSLRRQPGDDEDRNAAKKTKGYPPETKRKGRDSPLMQERRERRLYRSRQKTNAIREQVDRYVEEPASRHRSEVLPSGRPWRESDIDLVP